MKIQESQENYLKTIFLLDKKGEVRAIDVARELGFSKPSVSRAVHLLKDAGFLNIDTSGELKLTLSGIEKASEIFKKHETIKSFLITCLGIDESLAEKEACHIEHVIGAETFQAMKRRLKNSCWVSHKLHKEAL